MKKQQVKAILDMTKNEYRQPLTYLQQVFYSKDCDMYGVRKWNDRGKFWQQVLPPRKTQGARNGQSAYTCYKGVAQRWLKEYEKGA